MTRHRFNAARTVTLLVLSILSVAFVSYAIFDAVSRESSADDRAQIRAELDATRTELGQRGAQLDDQFATSQALQDQVESLGEEPVVDAGSPPQASTLTQIPGARGPAPSFTTVLRAVGQSINAALLEVCDGSCEATDGTDGTDGQDGADSTTPGIPGTNGTNGTNGKDGAKGDTGGKGDPGRGIVTGPTCNEDGTWTTTFTDGTTETQDGPCRVGLLPIPDPEPTE